MRKIRSKILFFLILIPSVLGIAAAQLLYYGTWNEITIMDGYAPVDHFDIADVDNNGAYDIISVSGKTGEVAVWLNTEKTGRVWHKCIIKKHFSGGLQVFGRDVDNDGDIDIIGAATQDDIVWWENQGKYDTEWRQHYIDPNVFEVTAIYPSDIDNDGDIDIISCLYKIDSIYISFNRDGKGTLWDKKRIEDNHEGVNLLACGNINNDGINDPIATAFRVKDVSWWNDEMKAQQEWVQFDVDKEFDRPTVIAVGDLEGDMDTDIVVGSYHTGMIDCYANYDGEGKWWGHWNIARGIIGIVSLAFGDIDNDGDTDIICAGIGNETISWLEHTNPKYPFAWSIHHIIKEFPGMQQVKLADMDTDGDLDIVVSVTSNNKMVFFENTEPGMSLMWSSRPGYNGNRGYIEKDNTLRFEVKIINSINTMPPTSIEVWIDTDGNNEIRKDEKYPMTYVEGDYSAGAVYECIVPVDKLSQRKVQYRFSAVYDTVLHLYHAAGLPTEYHIIR